MKATWPYKLAGSAGDYYFKDLQIIYELLKSTGEKVRIQTEHYEFDSFEELKQFSGVIKKIYFSISEPFINVEIHKSVSIYSNNICPLAQGIIKQLCSFTKKKAEIKRRKCLTIKKLSILVLIVATLFIIPNGQQFMTIGFGVFGITILYFATKARISRFLIRDENC